MGRMKPTGYVLNKFEPIVKSYIDFITGGRYKDNARCTDFSINVMSMFTELAKELRGMGLLCNVTLNCFELAVSNDIKLVIYGHDGYHVLDDTLEARFYYGSTVYWSRIFFVGKKYERPYRFLKEISLASVDPEFVSVLTEKVHAMQRAAKVREIGEENVAALAAVALEGREYRIAYRQIEAAVAVRIDEKTMVTFVVKYDKVHEQMMALPQWIETLRGTLDGIGAELTITPYNAMAQKGK